jgi:hypothetical protein
MVLLAVTICAVSVHFQMWSYNEALLSAPTIVLGPALRQQQRQVSSTRTRTSTYIPSETEVDQPVKEGDDNMLSTDTRTDGNEVDAGALQITRTTSPRKDSTREKHNNPVVPSRFAVFYHIDTSQAAGNHSLSVIQEQLEQVGTSYAAKQQQVQHGKLTLYYHQSHGKTHVNVDTVVQEQCAKYPSLVCRPLKDSLGADKDADDTFVVNNDLRSAKPAAQIPTLQSLYEFCQHQTDPSDVRVAYIHSSPSLVTTRRGRNRDKDSYGRQHATAAAMSQQCWEPADDKCHVCGLSFWSNWAFMFPGSQWTAQCSYVKELIPPVEFEEKSNDMVKEALLLQLREKLLMNLFPESMDRFGLGDKFAADHWIGGHPSIRPCDVSKTKSIGYWMEAEQDVASEFEFAMAPRQKDAPWDMDRKVVKKLRSDLDLRMKEYYLLAGKVFQWYTLYDKVPPGDSWVWSFFPDGDKWKAGAKEHGRNVINVLTGDSTDTSLIDTGLEGRSVADTTVSETSVDFSLDASSPPFAVFYNIYIPKDDKKTVKIKDLVHETDSQFAVEIVKEQLEQVGKSYAATSKGRLTLFYNTIGNGDVLDATRMTQLCADNGFDCRHMRHFDEGGEDKTLQRIYEFCQDQDDDFRVSYIHSKGTFHQWEDGRNDRWRRHGTAAATGEMCLNPSDDSCNVCGLQFWTNWSFFFPGNFFTAKCSYVKKLIPPESYEDRITELTKDTLLMRLKGRLSMNLFSDRIDRYGLYRYAMEAWIGGHPSIQPCDVSKTNALMYWLDNDHDTDQEFEFAMAPRQPDAPFDLDTNMEKKVRRDTEMRMKEYYFLAGKIFKWYTLYNEVPSRASWIWKWFPDGERWREGAELHGKNVVEILNGPKGYDFLEAPEDEDEEKPASHVLTSEMATTPVAPFAIFYHVYVPEDRGIEGVQNALRIVEEQLGQIGGSYAGSSQTTRTIVYYTTTGSRALDSTHFTAICENLDLDCRHTQHYDEGFEDKTIQKVHEYCQDHESHRVIYMHSKGSFHHADGDNDRWRRMMTLAVTSEMCLNPPDNSCNVCGLIFYNLWTMFLPGNFWTADCSYIKKLVRPETFEEQMTDITEKALLNRLQKKFATNLFTDRSDHFGIERYSMEHWVGSHPHIKPCDVSDKSLDLADWTQGERSAEEFKWGMAPRRKTAPIDNNPNAQTIVYGRRANRMREYYLLPGNIFKWFALYNETPPHDSWIWSWFPDGEEWRLGSTMYGQNVTDVLTQHMAAKALY